MPQGKGIYSSGQYSRGQDCGRESKWNLHYCSPFYLFPSLPIPAPSGFSTRRQLWIRIEVSRRMPRKSVHPFSALVTSPSQILLQREKLLEFYAGENLVWALCLCIPMLNLASGVHPLALEQMPLVDQGCVGEGWVGFLATKVKERLGLFPWF